ncbi:extracellular solute-binding protein [Pseudokineococcus basanitobsidens]|uniref:Extracellular solute-binding protein n=1 Tax=Pseudokineococcus basanitobsidens TaxID=1926649 RepID=A0ABU8RFF6_9ACTN
MGTSQKKVPRRDVLRWAGAFAGATALAGCSTAPPSGASGGPRGGPAASGGPGGGTGGAGDLTWWDQFGPLRDLHAQAFARFEQSTGRSVQYTRYNPNEQGQALQLAFGSGQLPDVFSLAGVNAPPVALRDQGWFSPLVDASAISDALPDGSLVDGLHVFDGQTLTFPLFSARQYESLNWYTRDQAEQAGLDPDDPPRSWDDLRAAARRAQRSGTSGLLLPLAFPDRMRAFVLELAQTAGFPGSRENSLDGVDLTTGEYRFHDDAFVDAIEFLLSFQQDGTLFPASTSLDARAGRARWAAAGSVFFLDGPYCAGAVANDFPDVLDQLAVGPVPTPDGAAPVLTRPASGGTFWVSSFSDKVDAASELLQLFAGEEYQSGLAAAMDQPPLDLSTVEGSDAHPSYQQAVAYYQEQVFLGPTPQAKNPLVGQVEARMRAVEPGLGAIVQGVFSGQVGDVRGALRQLSDQMTTTRQAAIDEVGGDVGVGDWSFPRWSAGQDFTAEDYRS